MKHLTRAEKRRLSDAALSVLAILLGLLISFPVFYCFLSAFKTPAEFMEGRLFPRDWTNLSNFKNALTASPLLRYSLNSLAVAALGAAGRLVVGIPAAYALTFYDFKGKRLVFLLILGTMMLPAEILLLPNYITVSRLGLLGTFTGMCIVSFVGANQIFMLRQKFLTVSKELRQAAELDGCGDLRYMLTFLLPICRGVIAALFVQSFTALWNAYLWPLVITAAKPEMRTIMVAITRLNSWEDTNYEMVLAGVALSLIPGILLFFAMRKSMAEEKEE